MAEKERTVVIRSAKKARTSRAPQGAPGPKVPDDAGRGGFATRAGFVLSVVGSAVGFGSIARFPFMTANNGGAAFVLVYAGMMLVVGIPMMLAEFSIGRASGLNAVGALAALARRRRRFWRGIGIYLVCVATFFLGWYVVTVGWVLRYVWASATGAYFEDPVGYFVQAQQGPDALVWAALALVVTIWVVARGISHGIERANLIMIPSLFVIFLGLVSYAATLDGGGAGYRFYLKPDWGEVTPATIKAAVAQAFFSLSLGVGMMITYASYIDKRQNLATNAILVSTSTLGFAFLAGLMVFPMLAALGILGSVQAGIGLVFIPLPQAFADLGDVAGRIVGFAFFTAMFFAAFTSAISLLEPATAYLREEWGLARPRAALLIGEIVWALALFGALDAGLLNLQAGSLTDAGVLFGGLFVALFVGAEFHDRLRAAMDSGDGGLRLGRFAAPIVRYAMPVVLLVLALVSVFGNPAVAGIPASDGFVDELRAYLRSAV